MPSSSRDPEYRAPPVFQVRLENITDKPQPYTLVAAPGTWTARPPSGPARAAWRRARRPRCRLEVPVPKRGYYDLDMTLIDAAGRELMRRTSFALLPPDTRKHRDQSPFGTYDYGRRPCSRPKTRTGAARCTSRRGCATACCFPARDPEEVRPACTATSRTSALRQARRGPSALARPCKHYPDMPPYAMIFHETSISGDHMHPRAGPVPRPAPLSARARRSRSGSTTCGTPPSSSAGRCARSSPNVKIALGNGPMPTQEEFFRHHFPAELFDSGGNESGSYNRPPEAQPPDWIANNASLWMERQMLDAYGYKDKPVTQCHEICYPNTNPGNLSLTTQADYFVRHAMHSLAWGIPQIRMGIICDVGGSYYYGNWGGVGLLQLLPRVERQAVLRGPGHHDLGAGRRQVPQGRRSGQPEPLRRGLRPARRPARAGPVDDPRPAAGAFEVQGHGRRRFQLVDDQANETVAAGQGRGGGSHAQPHARLSGHARRTGRRAGRPTAL